MRYVYKKKVLDVPLPYVSPLPQVSLARQHRIPEFNVGQ